MPSVVPYAQPTQVQMYYAAERNAAEMNLLFLEFVKDGLTREELQTNINRRPRVWARYSAWLAKLPSNSTSPVLSA